MISTSSALLALTLLIPCSVRAANDWSVPCVHGGCSWDTGDGYTTAYSSMAIGGNKDLISDITPAAGWKITGCDPNWKDGTHTIQMMCIDPSDETGHCGHMYEGGAEHTIVRLPENCGKGPFARVVSATNNTDSISRRAENSSSTDGTHTLTLDYNFHKVPTSRGKVAFAVTATNIEGIPGVSKRDLDTLRGRGRARGLHRKRFAHLRGFRRGFGDIIKGAEDAASDAADAAADAAGDAANAVTSAAGSAASAVSSAISDANSFNKTLSSGKLTPISFSKDVVLFDKSISCTSGDISANAGFKVDVDGAAAVTVEFGVTLVGTIVPPKLDDISVTSGNIGGGASATFTIDAKAEGKFDTTPIPLFKFGFPGLSIPSIITIGPEFSISAQAIIDLKAEVKLAVLAAWEFPTIKLIFPPEKGASSGDAEVTNSNNPLTLSAAPSADVTASISAHIIPRVDFGIDLFGGVDQASIFVNADISATLTADAFAKAVIDNKPVTTTAAAANATSTASNATQTDIGNPIVIAPIANATKTAGVSVTATNSIPIPGPVSTSAGIPTPATSAIASVSTAHGSTAVAGAPTFASSSPIESLHTASSSIALASSSAALNSSGSTTAKAVTSATAIPTSVGVSHTVVSSAEISQTGKASNTVGIATGHLPQPPKPSSRGFTGIVATSTVSRASHTSDTASEPKGSSSTKGTASATRSETRIIVSASSDGTIYSVSTAHTVGHGTTSAAPTMGGTTINTVSAVASPTASTASDGSIYTVSTVHTAASGNTSAVSTAIHTTINTVSAVASPTVSTTSDGTIHTYSTLHSAPSGTVSTVSTVRHTTVNTVPVVVSTAIGTAPNGTHTTVSMAYPVASATYSAPAPVATGNSNNAASEPATSIVVTGGMSIHSVVASGTDISDTPPIVTSLPVGVTSIGRNGSTSVVPQASGPATRHSSVATVIEAIPTFSPVSVIPTKPLNSTRPLRCRPQKNSLYRRGANHKALSRRATSDSTNGCITLIAGIAVNAGLTGSLEPFIDKKEVSFKIFSKDIQIFQKCLKDPPPAAKRRRNLPNDRRDDSGLQCPIGGIASVLETLI